MRIHHATIAKAKKFHIRLEVEDNEVVAYAKDDSRLASGLQGNKVLEDAITKQTGHVAKKSVVKASAIIGHARTAPIEGPKTATLPSTGKEVSIEERTARGEGWTKKRGGGFRHIETDDESEAETWEELCEEQGLLEETGDESDALADEGDPSDDEIDAEDDESEAKLQYVKDKYKKLYAPHKGKCGDELSIRLSQHVDTNGKVDKAKLKRFAEANGAWKPSYGSLTLKSGAWNGGMARMNVSNILRARIRKDPDYKIKWA